MWTRDDSRVKRIQVRAVKDDWFLHAVRVVVMGEMLVLGAPPYRVALRDGEFERIDETDYGTPYGENISYDAAQVLMDDLWRCGLRPTEGKGSAGAMVAVQEHLGDLQRENAWLKAQVERLLSAEEKKD